MRRRLRTRGVRSFCLTQVISAAPVVPPISLRPELPAPVSDLCRRCLSKAPGDRYRTLEEVRLDLTGLIG
jgi:hypothetical protein